jgi:uncharacterized protein (TIRG00374 family)
MATEDTKPRPARRMDDPAELAGEDEIRSLGPEPDMDLEEHEAALLRDPRRLAGLGLAVVLLVVAIYVVFPKVVGLENVVDRIGDATWYWIVLALVFNAASFAAYVMLFRGILGGVRDDVLSRRLNARASYQITMAGLAATRVFSAAGAGGIALTYWALRKAGMERRRAACRMVAFLVLLYAVYTGALVVFGVLLRSGVLPGKSPWGATIVPAAIAGSLIVVFLLVALIPEDVERRLGQFGRGYRRVRFLERLAKGPATVATGVRTAIAFVRHPRRGAVGLVGAIGFWGANIAVLWASFEAFGGNVPFAVLVQGFFVGMAANLIPSPVGGVGSVDAGMIAAFVVLGIPEEVVFPAVLTYRVIAFWLPIPPGVVAYFQLRGTVSQWEREDAGYTIKSKVTAEAK